MDNFPILYNITPCTKIDNSANIAIKKMIKYMKSFIDKLNNDISQTVFEHQSHFIIYPIDVENDDLFKKEIELFLNSLLINFNYQIKNFREKVIKNPDNGERMYNTFRPKLKKLMNSTKSEWNLIKSKLIIPGGETILNQIDIYNPTIDWDILLAEPDV